MSNSPPTPEADMQSLPKEIISQFANSDLPHDQQILETIFKNVPIGILWKDRESRFVGCNDYFARHAGKTPNEIVGLTDYDMPWADTYAAEFISDDRAVMESKEPRLQYIEQFQSADGTSEWIQTNKLPLEGPDGEVTGVFITYQDVTNQVAIGEELNKMKTAAQEEKQRLARDLHDAVSQTLWTASIIADILPSLWERDQDKARKNLNQLRQLTRGALAEMRMLLLELRPTSLRTTSLHELLDHLAEATMSRKEIDISTTMNKSISIPIDTKMVFYRIAQECLNNISKHSKASNASIDVTQIGSDLMMVVTDDGRGFDPSEQADKGMGLSILQERVDSIHATINIESEPQNGTTIMVSWPIPESVLAEVDG